MTKQMQIINKMTKTWLDYNVLRDPEYIDGEGGIKAYRNFVNEMFRLYVLHHGRIGFDNGTFINTLIHFYIKAGLDNYQTNNFKSRLRKMLNKARFPKETMDNLYYLIKVYNGTIVKRNTAERIGKAKAIIVQREIAHAKMMSANAKKEFIANVGANTKTIKHFGIVL